MTGRRRHSPATVIVAPDEFGGTLSALGAARAIAAGWRSARPDDRVRLLPQSDGGPGFIDVLAAAGVITTQPVTVSGPLGQPASATIGVADDVVYLEAAQACGLHLLGRVPDPATALAATTDGVGDLVAAALDRRPRTIVVGLGGSATTDGGRGALTRLGGLRRAREALAGVRLIVASDVDNPLLGPSGAAAVFGPQKGADRVTVQRLEDRLTAWADELGEVCDRPGSGAAGGLGAALLAVGGTRMPGASVVAEVTGRKAALADADVIVTGEGRYDEQTARGKVIAALADDAGGTPLLVLAGQVRAAPDLAGVHGVYSVADFAGSAASAMARPAEALAGLAAQVARGWPDTGQ